MLDKLFIAMVEVDIGLGPSILPLIILVIMVEHMVFIATAGTEVVIGLKPAIFLHITMVD